MAGGAIGNVSEIRARVEAHVSARREASAIERWADWPRFDKRPGALEATRGLTQRVTGVIGARGCDGWGVQLQMAHGPAARISTIEGARRLAAELVALADLLEFGVPD